MFVRARGGAYAALGIGKQIDRQGSLCAVEYFDSPTSDTQIHHIDHRLIERAAIPEQTRIYHFDASIGAWEIGRLLGDQGDAQLVQFPDKSTRNLNSDAMFIRWARPIQDPTPFLANRINENPRFSFGRSAFIRSHMRQRAASMGMSSLLACAVELEAHQIEVVRRILQDPVQRYLLADEVGLGKTIEAGVLIRQYVLDSAGDCCVLVLVPAALVAQWRNELSSKFFLERYLDCNVNVISFDDDDRIRSILPKARMLVIDEAHHLTQRTIGEAKSIYRDIAARAPAIDRVLLLSATPALHNERGFLEILHLLDSATYPLECEAAFRRKIESRQELAEIVAALIPENALYLDYTIDQLVRLFPHDELLQQYGNELRALVETMPAEDDPALIEAIALLHSHLSEVYRLHRRILRNRRRSVGGLTPDRAGAKIVRYKCSDRALLTAAIDDWRFGEATQLDAARSEKNWDDRVRTFSQVIERASQYPRSGAGIVGFMARRAAMIGDAERFAAISRLLDRPGLFNDRANALITALRPILRDNCQCLVFCSDTKTADILARLMAQRLSVPVVRHDPNSNSWKAISDAAGHSILICDRRAEEGLNLQGKKKVVIHYDIPFNPNRIEQRLGRADRYGPGDAVRSLVLACDDDPLEMAWVTYLDTALKVFDRSTASLQYLIDKTVSGIARSLFNDGAEALRDLTAVSAGDQGLIEREIKALDQQDSLDALGAPPTDLFNNLLEVDGDWQLLARETGIWFEETLRFGRIAAPLPVSAPNTTPPFRYLHFTSDRPTLVSQPTFIAHCRDALDLPPRLQPTRVIKTIPYTFDRRTAVNPSARAVGVGLLRYGDPLISGMMALTESDDRGRSFAMWRYIPSHIGDPVADFYFRFDFVLEANIAPATKILNDFARGSSAAHAAVRRRGDMALPPFYRSVWLDRELALVTESELLASLVRPYTDEAEHSGAVDLHLNTQRWHRLFELQIPETAYWSELCGKARSTAESALRSNSDIVTSLAKADQLAIKVDDGRLSQLRARARAGAEEADYVELLFEEKLSAALREGIRSPQIRLDAIGAIFLSASRVATNRVSGVA